MELVRKRPVLVGAVALVALMGISLYLRTRLMHGPFWIDEGLSVGIASFPFTEIPGELAKDGSPPLYYMLLHVWMSVFGSGVAATHALSLLFAVGSVPAALWAGWSLFGRRAGWAAAALAAFNPYLTIYAQETRMYALLSFLSILTAAAFLHAFAFRRRGYLPVFAALLVVMLYTHNWALFFTAGALIAFGLILKMSSDRRALLKDGALAFGAAGLAYLPWVPTLVSQAQHTGAPWSRTPGFEQLTGGFFVVLSGQGVVVAIVLAGGVGLIALARSASASPARTAIFASFTIAAGTLTVAWLSSQIAPAWTHRYLGVLVGPVLLLAAGLVPRAGRLGLVAVGIVLLFWIPFQPSGIKENADVLGHMYADEILPGDLVVSTQPEQVPVLAYYLGREHEYASTLGRWPDTRIMDWRDVQDHLEASTAENTLKPLLDDLPVGSRVFLIRPRIRDPRPWGAPWTSLVAKRTREWYGTIVSDRRFERTGEYVPPYTGPVRRPLILVIFEKTEDG